MIVGSIIWFFQFSIILFLFFYVLRDLKTFRGQSETPLPPPTAIMNNPATLAVSLLIITSYTHQEYPMSSWSTYLLPRILKQAFESISNINILLSQGFYMVKNTRITSVVHARDMTKTPRHTNVLLAVWNVFVSSTITTITASQSCGNRISQGTIT